MPPLIPTPVVGSSPQPECLVARAMLGSGLPPRTRALEIWRVPAAVLEQAQDDATVVAIRDMERAGIDIITDGEVRREGASHPSAPAPTPQHPLKSPHPPHPPPHPTPPPPTT